MVLLLGILLVVLLLLVLTPVVENELLLLAVSLWVFSWFIHPISPFGWIFVP